MPHDAARRLQRLERLAWWLDRSIPLGRWRVGFDPVIGLVPGAGDWVGGAISLYILYEGARLGIPVRVLVRMAANILVETIVGEVPLLGDFFDFVWQANTRNMALIRQHYRPDTKPRSLRWILTAILVFATTLLATLGYAAYLVVTAIIGIFQ